MNVLGLRARYVVDPETGSPRAVNTKTHPSGEIKLFARVDRSRAGLQPIVQEVFKVHWSKVPQRMQAEFFLIAKPDATGGLACDPRADTWTAPDWIEWIDLVTSFGEPDAEGKPTPGKIHSVRPKPDGWAPDPS